jgi:hypothetical protein
MRRSTMMRLAAAATGAGMLVGIAQMAVADGEQQDTDDVNVSVAIADTDPGLLAMSVAEASTVLTESGSDATVRQFTGTLPLVTVTDTRNLDAIPAGVGWYVLGTATDFHGDLDQPDIGAGHLGWTPELVEGGEEGLVTQGDPVATVLDVEDPDAKGLVDQELLALAIDSGAIAAEGEWSARAGLVLKTDPSVAPGTYSSTLTLTLFE